MKKIILIGAGGHVRSCIDVIEQSKKYEIFGLIDNEVFPAFFYYKKRNFFIKIETSQ